MFYNSVVGGWNYPLLGNTARLLRLYRLGSALRALLLTLAYWITSVQPTYTTYRVDSQPFWISYWIMTSGALGLALTALVFTCLHQDFLVGPIATNYLAGVAS